MEEYTVDSISQRVHDLYWMEDMNCAVTTLIILSGIFDIPVHSQVLSGACGMHGAGKFGAQCGLVEGTLIFLGISGKNNGLNKEEIEKLCYEYASLFQKVFGSLLCRVLRPQGFKSSNPPHLCEDMTVKSIIFSADFISGSIAGNTKSFDNSK